MTELENHILMKYSGVLVIGDLHAQFSSLELATDYARHHNLFIISLGDLVDRGTRPFETVQLIHQLVSSGDAAFVIGNHDDKFGRYAAGRDVVFSTDAQNTIEYVGSTRMNDFLAMYWGLIHHSRSSLSHTLGDITMTHGAYHADMVSGDVLSKKCRYRALYGEVSGERYPDGYPVRTYGWMDEVPTLKTVIVGHDRSPIHNTPIMSPMEVDTRFGGKVVFLDTGCGKGGQLSGAIITHHNGFRVDKYVTFKD